MDFIGRELEISKIKKTYTSNKNEFVAVYGRRRIGKTLLIRKVFNDNFDFYYTGIFNQTKKSQLNRFQTVLTKYGYSSNQNFKTWFDAFDGLKNYLLSLNKKVVCVFLDELQWMDSRNSNFVQSFADFWNMWDALNEHHVILKLYICGSGTSWIINKIIKDKGGLHNRLTESIHLKQFTMKETELYFKELLKINYSKMEILDIYMCVGGVPYYLSKFDKNIPIASQIDYLFFSENGDLREEYQYLYDSLFNNSKLYKAIINALCSKYKGLTRDELVKLTGIEGGTLSECLENLENCDFVRKYNSPKNAKKDSLYQITDLYTIFYLKFVANTSLNTSYYTNIAQTSKVTAWKGFAFERVLFLHVDNIKKALGINGVATNIYSWTHLKKSLDDESYQIDMIIDRNDNVMNVCEIKYSSSYYVISKDYADYVNKRIELFRNEIKTKKTLKNTFITTFGLSNEYHYIPDVSLTLNDIFN